MADVVGIKISQLESTTDLQDLYTIGTDKNNSSKKVKLQFLKEAADYANSQGDYAKGVADNSAGNIGVSDYPAFSESGSYASGDVVNYNGKLYRFTAPHQSGAWNGNDVVPTSINAESQRKLTELSEEVSGLSEKIENLPTAESSVFKAIYGVTTYEEIKAAYDSGKVVHCDFDNHCYILTQFAGTIAWLSSLNVTTNYMLTIGKNGWGIANYTMENTGNRKKVINAESTNESYPSCKAVYDFVQTTLGTIINGEY